MCFNVCTTLCVDARGVSDLHRRVNTTDWASERRFKGRTPVETGPLFIPQLKSLIEACTVRGHDVSNIDDVSKQCCHPHLIAAPPHTTDCGARRIRAVPYGWNGPVPGDLDASRGPVGAGPWEKVCVWVRTGCVRILGARKLAQFVVTPY